MSQTVLLLLKPVASHSSTFCSLLNFVQQPAIFVATINNKATFEKKTVQADNRNTV